MKFLIANWKMNGDLAFSNQFIEKINCIKTKNKIVVCPPFPLLFNFNNFQYELGAQNCSIRKNGAMTGEVSPVLLKELGCHYVIIGHSERRNFQNETNEEIFQKFKLLIELDIVPILCIGEKFEEKNNWKEVLSIQLSQIKNDKSISKAIIAYEPVWSIGTGIIPSIDKIEEKLSFIKSVSEFTTSVVYGGSVNKENCSDILGCPCVDGLLIGGASLKTDEFSEIIKKSE